MRARPRPPCARWPRSRSWRLSATTGGPARDPAPRPTRPCRGARRPAGPPWVSAEGAGDPAKPVQGEDGTRVPLLRAGFRPNGPYAGAFVYLEPGTPLAKKGGAG